LLVADLGGGGCLIAEGKNEIWGRRGSTRSYINYYRWNYRQNFFVYQSLNNFIGISDTSLYDFFCLNPTVITSVKASTKITLHRAFWFFLNPFIPIRIPSIFTSRYCPSVNTERNGDRNNSIGKYHAKIPTEYFCQ
jgi:hypothetical protein